MKVSVNQDCIGCGLCQAICPQVFVVENGISKVVGTGNNAEVLEAAESCPTNAIEVQ